MNLIDKFEFKLNLTGWITQLAPFILVYTLVPFHYMSNIKFLLIFIMVLFLGRYPHEYLHKLAAYVMGFKSIINFKQKNPTCTPAGILKWNEVLIFSLSPFVVLGIFYCLMMLISFYLSIDFIFYIFLGNFITLFATCAGDFGYVYYALKYKGHLFKDTGAILEVYKN